MEGINLAVLLRRLDGMGLIAILSETDMEYAIEQLTGLGSEDLTLCSQERTQFLESQFQA